VDYQSILDVCRSQFEADAARTASVGGSGTLALDKRGGIGFPEALTCVCNDRILRFEEVSTPFGDVPMVKLFAVNGQPVVRIPMHGWRLPVATLEHTQATFWLLDQLGVHQVIVDASVGGIGAKPMDVVIPDDVYNHEPAKIAMAKLAFELGRDPWVRMYQPFCPRLRSKLVTSVRQVKTEGHELGDLVDGGVYWTTPLGPFETAFEIATFKTLGATIVGQSSGQEALAARILGMCLAVANPVVNFAEGLNNAGWSGDKGMDSMYEAISMPMALMVYYTLERIVSQTRTCDCQTIAHSPDLAGLTS